MIGEIILTTLMAMAVIGAGVILGLLVCIPLAGLIIVMYILLDRAISNLFWR